VLADAFQALAAAFGAQRLRWYLFGAQAVVVHGRPRLTTDIDVAVELGERTVANLVDAMAEQGIDLRFPLDARLQAARLLPAVHSPSRLPIDIVITSPGFDEEVLDRALPVQLGGVVVPVVSPEDLIAMKILAGRPKDLEDVRGVVRACGERLDVSRVREVVKAFVEATGEKKLEGRLERVLRDAGLKGPGRH
jgi:hypothetical protein